MHNTVVYVVTFSINQRFRKVSTASASDAQQVRSRTQSKQILESALDSRTLQRSILGKYHYYLLILCLQELNSNQIAFRAMPFCRHYMVHNHERTPRPFALCIICSVQQRGRREGLAQWSAKREKLLYGSLRCTLRVSCLAWARMLAVYSIKSAG